RSCHESPAMVARAASRGDASDCMADLTIRWRALRPAPRALWLFFLVNSVGLNLLLAALPWTPGRKTVFNYTARTLLANGGTDSWGGKGTPLGGVTGRPEGGAS